jgi:uncharacterized OB-fold protein
MSTCLAPELFASAEPLALAGSRCQACATVGFPASDLCGSCGDGPTVRISLPDRGTIWTWTMQRFAPKAPYQVPSDGFAPFAVGYVDLGDVLVESLIVGDAEALKIGLPVHLVRQPIPGEDDTWSFAFRV